MNFEEHIRQHSLKLDSHYENLASQFCNIEGYKKEKTGSQYVLGSWFEGYLYCLLLGLKIGEREGKKGKWLDKKNSWSPYNLDQYKYAIGKVLSDPRLLNELGIASREQIDQEYTSVRKLLLDVKQICDEFVNGGLEYLSKEYKKNDMLFSDHMSLKRIFLDAKTQ